ncbi:putative homoserine kinase [Candidatus Magnetoovum chiemensis]|nr:putative homoserine kinase [Candidatus Magnetoovum chiemensis]
MKYIVLIGDGMADLPLEQLEGRTPLQAASTPNMDKLASRSITGMCKTVPDGMSPGSDIANLSILGYDPRKYYTGRAPLEAASMGINLDKKDVAYRCNLVYIKNDGVNKIMADYSAGHITSVEAKELISVIKKELTASGSSIDFYPGVSYRHLMLWRNGIDDINCSPPHDITGREISNYLPKGKGSDILINLMERSFDILKNHEINKTRIKENKNPANSIWLWGQGLKPDIPLFEDKYSIKGALISAVDLTKGLGIYAGLKIINVPGATGYLDTNYEGKARYAVDALKDVDFVYVHVEAPDETGHMGLLAEKIRAIEDFDRRVVGEVLTALDGKGDFRLLIMPDHPTPISLRTHSANPVPFILYDSTKNISSNVSSYDETIGNSPSAMLINDGHTILDTLIKEK